MGRKAEVLLYSYIYTISTDIPRKQAKDVAATFDDYCFPFYFEDEDRRLSWVYQPSGSARGIARDIESLKRNNKPAVKEIFDVVNIINEETGKIYLGLRNVDLFGIMKGIQDVFYSWMEKRLRSEPDYDFYRLENSIISQTYIGMFKLTEEQAEVFRGDLENKRSEYEEFFSWLRNEGREPFKLIFNGRKTVDEIIAVLSEMIKKNMEQR
ncbi:MAG: hypothetical protein HZB33_12625 [Nitrospirae bacterium]|nr:hypothetical protein [Nitrospirota bacterium]